MTKARLQKVDNFLQFQQRLFPDGNIPTREEIKNLVQSGDTSVRTYILNKMYRDGVPTDPFLLLDERAKDFANKFNDAFGKNTLQTAKNITGVVKDVDNVLKKGFTLEDDFITAKEAGIFPEADRKAFENRYNSTAGLPKGTDMPVPTIKGSKKLASGKVPKGLLTTVLEAIGSIPDEVLRDAAIASLIGYRGADLVGSMKNEINPLSGKFVAAEEYPVRPYYNPETKSLVVPDIDIGAGRKAKDPLKELGPLMQSIFDRRFASATDIELFPDIGTQDISNALNKHVFPKIPKEVLAHLKTQPKGYAAMRKIFASAVANDLGKPEIAAQLMGHGTGQLAGQSVLNKFYATIIDEGGLQARTDTLLQLEKFMADAVKVTTSGELATKLNLKLDNPDLNMIYPEFDTDQTAQGPEGQKIQLSEKELQAQEQERIKTSQKRTQDQAVAIAKGVKEEVDIYKDISKEDIDETTSKKALEKFSEREKTAELFKQKKAEDKKLRRENLFKRLQEISKKDGIKSVAGFVGAGTAAKLGVGVLSGGTAFAPIAAEAAAEVALSSTPTGEEAIDPKTGLEYMQPERPPSDFMTEDEIKKASIMAKSQFKPDVFQQAELDREAQRDRIQSLKGQSFLTGSGIN